MTVKDVHVIFLAAPAKAYREWKTIQLRLRRTQRVTTALQGLRWNAAAGIRISRPTWTEQQASIPGWRETFSHEQFV